MTNLGFDPRKLDKGQLLFIPGIGQVEVMRRYDSHNRTVVRVKPIGAEERRIVVKTFNFNGGGMETSNEEAAKVQKKITEYRNLLMKAGVPVTEYISFLTSTVSDGSTFLIQLEPHAGNTTSEIVLNLKIEAVCDLATAVAQKIIKPLFLNASDPNDDSMVGVGLDLHLRNITCREPEDEEGFNPTYIDYFPWKTKEGENYFLEYPEPQDVLVKELGIFRNYNKAGLIINLFISLCSVRPEGAQFYYNLLEDFLRTEGFSKVESAIDKYLGDKNLEIAKDKKKVQAMIEDENWGFEKIFRWRLLACAAAFHHSELSGHLKKVLEQTHFSNQPLSAGAMSSVKDMVLQMFV